tara:strand:- start:211 stop:501 length:291 start_codon:yes stop_codon:yes gene_type:complete
VSFLKPLTLIKNIIRKTIRSNMIKEEAIANILNDDSFKEAMDELVKMHLDMLINSDVDDKLAREICYMRITTINEIMAHLQSIADQKKIDNKRWKI